MLVWAIAASLAAAFAVIILILYRRQIGKICRQLCFVHENRTNMKLSTDELFADIDRLAHELNEVLYETQNKQFRMQEHENAIRETITNLSHDIRTPLTSLDGYFQLLAESTDREEQQRYAEIIRRRITSLRGILEELFTYAKLQDEEYQPELVPMEMNKVVYDAVFSFYEDCRARGLEPQIDICEERLIIRGDEGVISRMLQNIIKNSLEHGKGNVRVRLARQGEEVVFSCANDVDGQDEIDVNRVFERFYKADEARSSTSTGLGLAIARGLAEKCGARIEASYESGVFAVTVTFKAEMP